MSIELSEYTHKDDNYIIYSIKNIIYKKQTKK